MALHGKLYKTSLHLVIMLLCQDLVQVKMRSLSSFNLLIANPRVGFL